MNKRGQGSRPSHAPRKVKEKDAASAGGKKTPPRQAERKWGAYTSEKEYLTFARERQPPARERWQSLEAQVMDWADDIASSVSDSEDFFRAGLIPLERIARRWTSQQLGKTDLPGSVVARLAADAIAGMTDQQALLVFQRLTGVIPGGAFDNWAR